MSESEVSNIDFRDDALEQRQIVERNREAAKRILEKAGISSENPNYKYYFGLTMANVHHAGQYAVYDDSVEQLFTETLKDPDMTLAQYREATRQYKIRAVESQQKNASGIAYSGRDESYNALMKPYRETLKSGVAMRHETGITFPKEFYNDKGNPVRRLVVQIDSNSAWNIVNEYALKHREAGVSFNGEAFVVNGDAQSPGKFFNSKAQKLDKFAAAIQKEPAALDLTDKELLDLVERGDYEGVKALNKERGMAGNNRNKALRELLKQDKDLFGEVRLLINAAGGNGEHLAANVSGLAQKMKFNAELFHKETESGKFHAPKDDIDRIVFSVLPDDLAKQSTFQDWKSCMNAVGCNHHYVDDTIGQGSIIAYGYNSKNPQKMISRILIQPYTNDITGETIYNPNYKVYGEDNVKFKEIVAKVVDRRFNAAKSGGLYQRRPGLYGDGNLETISYSVADYSAYTEKRFIHEDFSEYNKVIFGDGAILESCTLSKNVKFGESVTFRHMTFEGEEPDLSGVKYLNFGDNVVLGKNVKLPQGLTITGQIPDGMDLSGVQDLKFGDNIVLGKDFKLPDGVDLSGVKNLVFGHGVQLNKDVKLPQGLTITGQIPDGADLSGVKDLKLGDNVVLGKDVKLPDGVDMSGVKNLVFGHGAELSKDMKLSGKITLGQGCKVPEGMDLSGVEDLNFGDNVVLGKDVKLPKRLTITGQIPDGMDLSGMVILRLQNASLGKDVKLPERLIITGQIFDGMDLSGVNSLNFGDNVVLGKDVKLPQGLTITGKIPDGMNLSEVKNLTLENAELSKDIKLPENVILGYGCKIPEEMDLSGVKNLTLAGAKLSPGVKLPESICVQGCVPSGADLSTVRNMVVKDCSKVGETLLLPENVALKYEGFVLAENAEMAQELLQKDLSQAYLMVSSTEVLKGWELPADVPVVAAEGAGVVVVNTNADDKVKKELDSRLASFAEDGVNIQYITPEEFEKKTGATFVKTNAAEKTAQAKPKEPLKPNLWAMMGKQLGRS